jgi:hypothetical protein
MQRPITLPSSTLSAANKVDEKSQIQALDRTQPGLPMKKGRCGTLAGELPVVGQLELTHPMWLQAVSAPDALHRADADALHHLRYGGRCPVRRLCRWTSLRGGHETGCNLGFERRDTRRPRLVTQHARDTICHEALLPAPDSRLADNGIAHDLRGAAAVCRQQRDPRTPDVLLRGAFRSATIASSWLRSVALTSTLMPVRIRQTRISPISPESPIGLKCVVLAFGRPVVE